MPRQLSDIERTRVVELKAKGFSDRRTTDILQAEGTPIDHTTVNRIWSRWLLKNRSENATKLSRDPNLNPREATGRTFRNYVKNQGLESRVHPQHTVVDEVHRKQRLRWAKA